MKKICLISACIIFLCIKLTAQVPTNGTAKVSAQQIEPQSNLAYYKFYGFDFAGYSPSSIGIEDIVKAEYNAIALNAQNPYAIVGHSQGGLRVLGYSTFLKKTNPAAYKKLKGVITVSGIDSGLKALEGGIGNLKSKLYTDIGILTNGLYGSLQIADFFFLDLMNWVFDIDIQSGMNKIAFDILRGVLAISKPMGAYLRPALYDHNLDTIAEIRDMIPQSNYIKNNVMQSENFTYKVQKGFIPYLTVEWRRGWWGIYYPVIVGKYYPIYAYYTGTDITTKLDPNLPIGYIVGTKSNTLSMADAATEKGVRDGFNTLGSVFTSFEYAHYVKLAAIVGLFTGSIGYANDCRKAKEWCKNIDRELNEIKGSSENDGLVAKESQSIPQTSLDKYTLASKPVHTKVLNKGRPAYFNYNHAEIWEQEEVWKKIGEMMIDTNK